MNAAENPYISPKTEGMVADEGGPVHEGEQYVAGRVWYASEKRSKSSLRLRNYDDGGRLSVHRGIVSFQGVNQSLEVVNIQGVELVSQTFCLRWCVVVALLVFVLSIGSGLPVFVALLGVIATVLIHARLQASTKWVKVGFQSPNGESTSAWFADGRNLGWDGLLGGTRKLGDRLRLALANASDAPIVFGNVPSTREECPWCGESLVRDEHDRCPACDRPI
jgi:hypothetical protein